MFEWQKFSQESDSMPHYDDLLAFINLRAQASKTIASESKPKFASKKPNQQTNRAVTSFAASANDSDANCVVCKIEKNPLSLQSIVT